MEAQALAEFAHRHLNCWIDEPLPILKNKTPREAVKTKAGSEQVRELLKGQVNSFARMRTSIDVDVEPICRELGITL